jgi:hypothetical protein
LFAAMALRPERIQVLVLLLVRESVPMPLDIAPPIEFPVLAPPRLSVLVVPPLGIVTPPTMVRLAVVGLKNGGSVSTT